MCHMRQKHISRKEDIDDEDTDMGVLYVEQWQDTVQFGP